MASWRMLLHEHAVLRVGSVPADNKDEADARPT